MIPAVTAVLVVFSTRSIFELYAEQSINASICSMCESAIAIMVPSGVSISRDLSGFLGLHADDDCGMVSRGW